LLAERGPTTVPTRQVADQLDDVTKEREAASFRDVLVLKPGTTVFQLCEILLYPPCVASVDAAYAQRVAQRG
jgi:hypothetical protein